MLSIITDILKHIRQYKIVDGGDNAFCAVYM